ncbi:hypothetical protein FZEAL_3730 [Fusarium zealandicum]|uniref:AB hydrolase-1 domain-containing protein n=1 Tax=Fusarium zealandicum TaxID=1053134 RepID=A0A8H4UNW9_9HYPO|nr:hypothetical protein FZEAL_3730 [Fusarium zealandicum]
MPPSKPGLKTLADLGSLKLELTIHGPPRRAHNPIVIIIPGISSSIKEWAAVTRSLGESISVLNYERAGYGLSEPAPESDARTAKDLAVELHTLLRVAKITPPYIVVCHSYGSIIFQEFARLRKPAEFKGFVFVDANREETPLIFQSPSVRALKGDTDALQTCYRDCHRLGDLDWQALLDEKARPGHQTASDREISQYHASSRALATSKQLEPEEPLFVQIPLVVLHANHAIDLEKIYDEGVRLGNGTDSERAEMREFITQHNTIEEEMQRKLLGLSRRSRFQQVAGSGHHIHIAAPEAVVDAVIWILMQYRC